jgi:hypothetical protein
MAVAVTLDRAMLAQHAAAASQRRAVRSRTLVVQILVVLAV